MFLLYGNVVETLDVWDSFVSSHKLQTGFFLRGFRKCLFGIDAAASVSSSPASLLSLDGRLTVPFTDYSLQGGEQGDHK